MSENVAIYSAKMCGDCQNLKRFMNENGIAYEERDIKEDPDHAEELETRTGKRGVPYLVIDGEWRRGYEPGQPFSEAFARNLFGMDN